MARNDGVDRTSVRNLAVSDKAVGNTQQHNECEKDNYRNPDIIPQRTSWNVHFKKPTASYTDLFAQLEADGTISTRGLKPDATHYCELVFDVNSAYFDNHGGYEFAKQFYEDAYKAAVQIVGGEQYILSAVMHADEINRAMTEALGREVYHYHLHVVYSPYYILLFTFLLGYVYTVLLVSQNNSYVYVDNYPLFLYSIIKRGKCLCYIACVFDKH